MKNSRTYPRFELCNWVDIDGSLYEIIGIEQPQGEYLLREPGSHLAHREHWHIIDKYPLAILTPEFAKAIKDVEESKARYRKIAKSGATHHTHLNQPITTKDKENKMSKIKFREVNGQLFKLTEITAGSAHWALYQMMQGKKVYHHCMVAWIEDSKVHQQAVNATTQKLGGVMRNMETHKWAEYHEEHKLIRDDGSPKHINLDCPQKRQGSRRNSGSPLQSYKPWELL